MIIAFNIVIALIAVVITLYVLEKDLGLFLLSSMIIIQYVWMFFSLIVIESGVHIVEQGRNGYFIYSSLILLFFYISTILSLVFFKKVFSRTFKNLSVTKFKFFGLKENKLTLMLLGFVFVAAFVNLFSSEIPLFSKEITKFNFWENSKYPFLKSIVGNVMAFVAFGTALLYRNNKKIAILFGVFYAVYLILVGQKFTGFLIGIIGFLLGLYYTSENKIQFKLKWFFNKYFLIFIGSIFCLVLYMYTINPPFKNLGLTAFESVFYRAFGLQAHVFWGTTEQYVYLDKPNTWDTSELWKGMHHLMLEFWPWRYEDFISVISRGVSWTNAYPSILLRIFPLAIALIVNFILLSFLSLIQTLLEFFIKRKSFLISIVFFQLLIWTSYSFTMAYFNKLIIPVTLTASFFLYKYLIYYQKTTKNE
jgi:hypothetical protein